MHDPDDLEVSAHADSGGRWKWVLSVGAVHVKIGTVEGTRDDALEAGREERKRLISEGKKV